MITPITILALVTVETQGPVFAPMPPGVPISVAEQLSRDIPPPLQLVSLELSSPIEANPNTPVSVEWKTAPRPGSNSVRLTFQLPKEPTRRWAFVRLATADPVLVYRRALPAGHVLARSDLAIANKPRGVGLDLLPSSLVGKVLSRTVSANEPVAEDSVTLSPPVPGQSPVDIIARVGLVEVRLSGVLDRAVRVGARGKVRVSSSGRTLRGRLVDTSTFVLNAPGDKP